MQIQARAHGHAFLVPFETIQLIAHWPWSGLC
jgi:hypothetical protein